MDTNRFTKYIFERIERKDYRGIHLSQHNRLPFDKVIQILKTIYEFAKESAFKIHIGDWKGKKQENCQIYYDIVDNLAQIIKQCTVNSLKKNIFPDLHTMGFLTRYTKEGTLIKPHERKTVDSVCLTESALSLIHENNPRKQYKMYIEATEKLLEPIIDGLFVLLYTEFESINIYEYMFIISDQNLSNQEKSAIIKSYRRLKKIEKLKINQDIIKKFQEINQTAPDKSYKRDFGNWYNQFLQVFGLLNQTIYFKTFKKTILMLSISQDVLEVILKRSQAQKEKYFSWHKIERKDGYELHHICPLFYASTKNQLNAIDNFKNLIYITKEAHSKIPKDCIKLVYENQHIKLVNPIDTENYIDVTNQVEINENCITEMINYNIELLEKIES